MMVLGLSGLSILKVQSDLTLLVSNPSLTEISSLSQFDFSLPADQIAQYPVLKRDQSRLMVLGDQNEKIRETQFSSLKTILRAGDLLVCNNSRVIPARLTGCKSTGGRVEILVERILNNQQFSAQMRANRTVNIGETIELNSSHKLSVVGRKQNLFTLEAANGLSANELVKLCGNVPLPPYLNREAEDQDRRRYQTVYAKLDGSVAAPTAGLHFTESLMRELVSYGIRIEYVTLHVGAGTFSPIRTKNLREYKLHAERCELSEATIDAIQETKHNNGRVIAVGTTVLRTLESVANNNGTLCAFRGETDLFITPGFQFQVVDALITNFHLPRSSLLLLVCAFGGIARVLNAYHIAVEHGYRFYSYGDAMFIQKQDDAIVNNNLSV